MKKWVMILANIIGFVFWGLSASAETVDRVVAIVNSEIITELDLKRAIGNLAHQKIATGDNLKQAALRLLIEEKLFNKEIKNKKIEVTEQELDEAIAGVAKNNGITVEQLKKELAKQGTPFVGYQNQLRQQLTRYKFFNKVLANKVTVTEADYNRFIDQHGQALQSVGEVKLAQLILPLPASANDEQLNLAIDQAIAIQKQATSLKAFVKLAEKYSMDPGLAKPEKYTVSSLNPSIKEALLGLKQGQVSKPIRSEHGLHLIFLVEQSGLSDVDRNLIKGQIREKVMEYKMQEELKKYLEKLRESAYIEVKI